MAPKYYLPALARNPLVRLKYHLLNRRRPLPDGPLHAQIQTVTGCNANCIFCPNKKTERTIQPGLLMDMSLFRSIVDQCVDWGVMRFSPYLMNESMLDPRLPERIAYITRRKHPGQFSKINSHGGLLTERMAKGLLDAGLDRLNFSVQGLDPGIYQQTMNLPLRKTLDNIDRFLELKRTGGYKRPRVRVCMLVTKYIEPQIPAIKAYWGERGVIVNFNALENRGNHKAIQANSIASRRMRPFNWCNRLFDQIYILQDGRMVMCCADWEQTAVMGDARRESLRDIWQGSRYDGLRRRFLLGDVKGTICDGCTKDSIGADDRDD
ncbi:MAG: radical SAM protein [bacterium]|nr:radical SAM protein [bacterium]